MPFFVFTRSHPVKPPESLVIIRCAAVKTPDYIYVFEFKLDAPLSDAIEQIDDRGYMIPYTADGRKLYKVGVVFSMGKRNVADYEVRNCGP